ncbi:hypothetical protein L7F22_056894 [Adiantum nelumboides]|nr:hypothetical protein [Adiantum nelumboides]
MEGEYLDSVEFSTPYNLAMAGEPGQYTIQYGWLLYKGRLCITAGQRPTLLHDAHDSLVGGHRGINSNLEKFERSFFWPKLRKDVYDHVQKCQLYLIDGRRTILNVAFHRVRHNVKLRMIIPLKFRGRTVCPGLINGGTLWVLKKAVSCLVYPDEVPPYVEVDVSKLKIGERILMNDLNVDLASSYVVCEVKKYRLVRPNRSRSLARQEYGDIVSLGHNSEETSKNSQFWFLRS